MNINKFEIKKIAKLSGLRHNKKKLELYEKYLSKIINLFCKLKKINTDNIYSLHHVNNDNLKLRDDEIIEKNIKNDIMRNSPISKCDFYIVPKMIK